MERSRPRIPLLALLVAALLAGFAPGGARGTTATARPAKKPPQAVPGELLIGFRAGVSTAEQKKVMARIGATEKRAFKQIHGALANVRADATASALAQLRSDPRVRYAEPNFVVSADVTPNDPLFSRLWGLNNNGFPVAGRWGLPDADIDAPEAWSVTTGSDSVTVAVIDTGIDYSHPDLSSQIWINPGENCPGCRTDGIDNDGNGYVDDWRGWDFANGDNDPMDDNGHGTHVAGTIGAAGNNGVGIAGVNWHVRLMPLKFISAGGTGTTADAVSAVLYAADKGATVLNNSWGGDDYSQALADAITVADTHGALFVAAAGNSGTDNDSMPTYPASYALPNVLTVAATDNSDQLAYFSNVGRKSVDLGAPGLNIYSTWPGGTYQYMSGTSMAAPHVSGAAALAKAAFPAASGVGLKALLLESVDPLASLSSYTATGGRLNANNAVTCNGAPKLWFESPSSGFDAEVGSPVTFTAIATRCADSAGVTVTATANGSPVALAARGDGLYTGTYTPTTTGSVSLSVSATSGGTTRTRTISGVAAGVYAIAPGGPAVTITTRAPDENARLKFDGQAGQRVSLKLAPVSISTSYVSILKPDGTPLASNVFVSSFGGFVDTQTLPATGSYRIVVDPQGTATGSMTLTLYDVPPDATGGIAPGGSAITTTAGTPGQNARLTFDAQAGQRVSLNLSGVTISNSYVTLLNPDGTVLGGSSYISIFGGFVDTRALPSAGTYTILVDPQAAATGSMTLTLYDVPGDATGAIAFGGASPTLTMATPGQNASATFAGQAGQRASVKLATTVSSAYVSILNPDGSVLTPNTYVGPSGGFLDPKPLPTSGTYRILIDPQGAATGSMTLTLYDVPPDVTATIAPGGTAVAISANTPGQNARIAFDGQAGARISLKLTATTIANGYVSILNPNGSALASNVYLGTSGGFVDTKALPATGGYTILVDPQGASIGSTTLTLYDVPADAGGTLTVGGPSLLTAITTPGQNARITFAGRAGQHVTLQLSAVSVLISYLNILKPDGTAVGPSTLVTSSGRTLTADLPTDGTYAIAIDPLGAETGLMTLTLN
jgi:Subtilase family/Fervidolysin N-terminal prodomain